MKIIYFAGFGGTRNSHTFSNLLKKYPNTEFIVDDNENLNIAYNSIKGTNSKYYYEKKSTSNYWSKFG